MKRQAVKLLGTTVNKIEDPQRLSTGEDNKNSKLL